MCGGDIEASADMTVGKCLYCGSTMTLPRIESDKKARLYNAANAYRLNNEFDKAYDAYKSIVEEDEQESEAYWGMILSEYGVEYVEEPSGHKRVATCHRTHVQNIQNSANYQLALKYADAERRFMYQDEAEILDKLQRNILSVSSKEEGYDVFICYKESADDGQRTLDSVLAQEIYTELEKYNIRTFLARISLEDHIGENYEPYIYGALTTAKVMLVVTTNGEHCNAVWVKNEWKRFLAFMEEDQSKVIIPVYKDMSAYEFPPELSRFQAHDMGKVGAVQELVRGVQKLLGQTKTEKNDKALNELLADKRERDYKAQKRKKRRKKVVIGVLLVVAIIAAYIGIPRLIYREKVTVMETGTPNPDEYNMFEVEVTKENWDDYFYFEEVEGFNGYYALQSKIYDEGWYYYKGDVNYVIELSATTTQHGNGDLFPIWVETNGGAKPKLNACEGVVTFVYKDIVKSYEQESAFRKIVLKNGNQQDRSRTMSSDRFYLELKDYPY